MAAQQDRTDLAVLMAHIDEHYRARRPQPFRRGEDIVHIGTASYGAAEVGHVLKALLAGWISMGPETIEFERAFAAYVGTSAGIAVNSGSSANLIALAALLETGRLRRGQEVIAPGATFSTVLSPIIQLGLRPVIVDVDPLSYNVSAETVASGISGDTGAVIIVHTLGQPADLDPLLALARTRGLVVLEDCCEAHGSRYQGRVVGSAGDIATCSFYVAHNMTTGEGGMVLTSDPALETVARSLREFGRMRLDNPVRYSYNDGTLVNYDERYVFERLGYNMRMTDIAASFGIEQLRKLDAMNAQRIATSAYYSARLARYEEYLQLPTPPPGHVHSYYAYPVVVRRGAPFDRARLARFLESRRIETRALFGGSLVDQPAYRGLGLRTAGDLPTTCHLRDAAMLIGCHPRIGEAEREYVCDVFDEFFASGSRSQSLIAAAPE